jgi:hypothetical protein
LRGVHGARRGTRLLWALVASKHRLKVINDLNIFEEEGNTVALKFVVHPCHSSPSHRHTDSRVCFEIVLFLSENGFFHFFAFLRTNQITELSTTKVAVGCGQVHSHIMHHY